MLSFKETLNKLNLTKEKFYKSKEQSELAKFNLNNKNYTSEKQRLIFIEEIQNHNDIVSKICSVYEDVLDDYVVNIELISKFLDTSINYTQNEIAPYLDKLEFPPYDTGIKKYLKIEIQKKKEEEYFKAISGIEDLKELEKITTLYNHNKEKLKQQMNKKVLYSKSSFIKYLNKNLTCKQSFETITLEFSKEQMKRIIKRFKLENSEEFYKYSKKIYSYFIEKHKREIDKLNEENNYFDFTEVFSEFLEDKEDIVKTFKNRASLRVFFSTLYDSQITRELRNMDHDIFNLNKQNKKSNSIRVLLFNKHLLDKVKKTQKIYYTEKLFFDGEYQIDSKFFELKYKKDIEKLKEDIVEFAVYTRRKI